MAQATVEYVPAHGAFPGAKTVTAPGQLRRWELRWLLPALFPNQPVHKVVARTEQQWAEVHKELFFEAPCPVSARPRRVALHGRASRGSGDCEEYEATTRLVMCMLVWCVACPKRDMANRVRAAAVLIDLANLVMSTEVGSSAVFHAMWGPASGAVPLPTHAVTKHLVLDQWLALFEMRADVQQFAAAWEGFRAQGPWHPSSDLRFVNVAELACGIFFFTTGARHRELHFVGAILCAQLANLLELACPEIVMQEGLLRPGTGQARLNRHMAGVLLQQGSAKPVGGRRKNFGTGGHRVKDALGVTTPHPQADAPPQQHPRIEFVPPWT